MGGRAWEEGGVQRVFEAEKPVMLFGLFADDVERIGRL